MAEVLEGVVWTVQHAPMAELVVKQVPLDAAADRIGHHSRSGFGLSGAAAIQIPPGTGAVREWHAASLLPMSVVLGPWSCGEEVAVTGF